MALFVSFFSCLFLAVLSHSTTSVVRKEYDAMVEAPSAVAVEVETYQRAHLELSPPSASVRSSIKEYGASVEAPAPAPPALPSPCHTKLVVLSDGSITAVNEISGKKCWSFSSGALLASHSHSLLQVEEEIRGIDKGNASKGIIRESEDGHYDNEISDESEFAYSSGALTHLEGLLSRMPYVTSDGDLVVGSRSATVFLLDSCTGSLVWSFHPETEKLKRGGESAGVPEGSMGQSLESKLKSLTSFKPLYISQINYTVNIFEASTAKLKWNINFVEIGTLDLGQATNDHSQLSDDYSMLNLSFGPAAGKFMQKFGYRHYNEGAQFTPLAVFSSSDKLLRQLVTKHTKASSEPQIRLTHEEPVLSLPPAEERLKLKPPKDFKLSELINGAREQILVSDGTNKTFVPKLMPNSASMSVASPPETKGTFKVVWWVVPLVFGVVIGLITIVRLVWKRGGKEKDKRSVNGKKRKARKAPIDGVVNLNTKQLQSGEVAVQSKDSKEDLEEAYMQVAVSKYPKTKNGLVHAEGRRVGCLYVTNIIIGYGSHGTLVLEGSMETRKVAVKRLLAQYYRKARKEIDALIDSDAHPNVVRYYAMERDTDFVYVALERCHLNLNDLILTLSPQISCKDPGREGGSSEQLSQAAQNLEKETNLKLWDHLNHPSPLLLKLMRDIVDGLEYLHSLGYVHRDLKPQNVLINKEFTLCAKISDMGISKRLDDGATSMDSHTTGVGSSGWQAPEQILHQRQTRAVDLFSLGCMLFFCISGGQHPFGSRLDRDGNIVLGKVDLFAIDHMPEATHLIASLLEKDAKKRPSALEVKCHPFFWSVEKRLSFLRDSSDRIELEDRDDNSVLLGVLEAAAPVALGRSWDEKLDGLFLDNLGKYRRYNYQSVRDLLRVIRNKLNHYRELPSAVQELLGGIPEGYENYFRTRYPCLLLEVFKVIFQHCRREKMFEKYFAPSE
ncbi:hypothetical protein O6H91_12G039500 [Diphasiastrum complanatum]|uniref:Uncharacterized protein n=1 Tax=Diphasiastrum complanatum TaxID=34168 RepID=A0ACC2C0P9_DIPCM|nr:hypothetical protein O6H91_12G039500 [Diphasiastrum complanatum]